MTAVSQVIPIRRFQETIDAEALVDDELHRGPATITVKTCSCCGSSTVSVVRHGDDPDVIRFDWDRFAAAIRSIAREMNAADDKTAETEV